MTHIEKDMNATGAHTAQLSMHFTLYYELNELLIFNSSSFHLARQAHALGPMFFPSCSDGPSITPTLQREGGLAYV